MQIRKGWERKKIKEEETSNRAHRVLFVSACAILLLMIVVTMTGCGGDYNEMTPHDWHEVYNHEDRQDIANLEDAIQTLKEELANVPKKIEIIDPCGDDPNVAYEEILLRLDANTIVSYFKESGSDEFLTILNPGHYVTTDKQECHFEIVLVDLQSLKQTRLEVR